jgi:hypothetical protein
MKTVPRASLCVTILDDEDYRILMASNGGPEAFGVFAAMLVLGRERLQQGKARQLSETESLRFDNSTTHLLAMTHLNTRHLDRCLRTLAEVAKSTGSKPWMYLDDDSQLVIRSFFKFNAGEGWGGPRPGSGRKPRRNQVDSEKNQVETNLESSWFPSDPITDSINRPVRAPAPARVREGTPPGTDGRTGGELDEDAPGGPGYLAALEVVRTSLGDAAADRLGYEFDRIGASVGGRWDCIAAAAMETRQQMDQRNGTPVRSPFGLMLSKAKDFSLKATLPPPPVVAPPPKPKEPTPAYYRPLVISDRDRERVANARPPARSPAPPLPPKTGTGD